MTSVQPAELCRITVYGPAGRADLAVPVSIPVAALLPVLVKHTTDQSTRRAPAGPPGAWVVQRLGEPPMDAGATPEALDWLDGEVLYLRPTENPMPDMDFDDLAEGMANSVNRQKNRWTPELGRWVFLALTAGVLVAMTMLLLDYPIASSVTISALSLGVVLVTVCIVSGVVTTDRALVVVIGVPGCLLIGLATMTGLFDVPSALDLQPVPVRLGGLAVAVVAACILMARYFWIPLIPITPFAILAAAGLVALVGLWPFTSGWLDPVQTAGVVGTVLLGFVYYAPRLAVRMSRLRGPQLPRKAEEMQYDIDPLPAASVIDGTRNADRMLTVLVVVASTVFGLSYQTLFDAPGWAPMTLGILFTISMLVRSASFFGALQRIALITSGMAGVVLLVTSFGSTMTPGWRTVAVVCLGIVVVALVFAALRPPHRRLVPVWVQRSNWIESIAAIAAIPVLLQILGVYAWARGLAG
ncbi:type VII secretion integral membrane protein EccD [Kibdelosporangium philippinense]|uniref:Type VII secretion integral membrane protein EccD n=1 Tax=Kibdelosporangium philippinense TaxID=211113 RepID=A0ABS8ZEX2_9PSEU|nr:type VII secretion integral membrane protein EccD [Kibdelosporangium philippinense]MCE7006374.1 type VII secretion integral membrane protein EccD [Kibdelosporangium philippinense]